MSKILRVLIIAVLAVVLCMSSAFAIDWKLEEDDEAEDYSTESFTEGYNYRVKLKLTVDYTTNPDDQGSSNYAETAPTGMVTLESPYSWLKIVSSDVKDLSNFRMTDIYTDDDDVEHTFYYYDEDGIVAEFWLEGVLPDAGSYTPSFTLKLNGEAVTLAEGYEEPITLDVEENADTVVKPQILPVADYDTKDAYASFDVTKIVGLETANSNYEVYIVIPESRDVTDEYSELELRYEIDTTDGTGSKRYLDEDDIDLPHWLDYEVVKYDSENNLLVLRIFYSPSTTDDTGITGAVHIGNALSNGWDWTNENDNDNYVIGWNVTYSPSATVSTPSALAITEDSASLEAHQGNDTATTTLNFNASELRRLSVSFANLNTSAFSIDVRQDYTTGKLTLNLTNPKTPGKYEGTLTARDNYGFSDTAALTVSIDAGLTLDGNTTLELAGIPTKTVSQSISYTGPAPLDWYIPDPDDPIDPAEYEGNTEEYIADRDAFKITLQNDLGLVVNLSANPVVVLLTLPEDPSGYTDYLDTKYSLILLDSYGNEAKSDVTFSLQPLSLDKKTASLTITAGMDYASADFTVLNPGGTITFEETETDELEVSFDYSALADGIVTVLVSAEQSVAPENAATKTVVISVTDEARGDDYAEEITLNVRVNPVPALSITPSTTTLEIILDDDPVEVTFGLSNAYGEVDWDSDGGDLTIENPEGTGTTGIYKISASGISQGKYTVVVTATDDWHEDNSEVSASITVNVKKIVHVGELSSLEIPDALKTAITNTLSGVNANIISISSDDVEVGYARTSADIENTQAEAISGMNREAVVVLPEITVQGPGIYTFAVSLDALEEGTQIYLSIVSDDDNEIHVSKDKYAFFSSSNEEVSTVPEDKYVIVAVYLEDAGTYSFVITTPIPLHVSSSVTALRVYAGGSTQTVTLSSDNASGALTWAYTGIDGLTVSIESNDATATVSITALEDATSRDAALIISATDSGRNEIATARTTLTIHVIPVLTASISSPDVTVIIGEEATTLTLTAGNVLGSVEWITSLDKTGPTLTATAGTPATLSVSAGDISQGTYTATITATDAGRDEMATATVTLTINVKRVVKVGALSSIELTNAQTEAVKGNFTGVTADVMSIADDSVTVGAERTTISESQARAIAEIGRKAVVIIPEVTTTTSGIYTFAVSLDELEPETKIYLSIASDDSEVHVSENKYTFYNDSYETISTVPDNKHVIVAVYLEAAGTYSFVITVSEPLSVSPSAPSVSVRGAREIKTLTLSADNPAGVISWSFGDVPESIYVDYGEPEGDTLTLTISADSTDTFTSHTVSITATDAGREEDAAAEVVLTVDVIPEMSVDISANSVDVAIDGEPASVRLSVNYAVGTVTWTADPIANGPLVELRSSTGKTVILSISANDAVVGEYSTTITATDSGRDADEAITLPLTIYVKEASNPVARALTITPENRTLNVYAGGEAQTVTFTASNALGGVSWSTSETPAGLAVTPTTGTGTTFGVNISALRGAQAGDMTITVTAKDDGRDSDNTHTATITVTVKKVGSNNSGKVEVMPVTPEKAYMTPAKEAEILNTLSYLDGVDDNTEVADLTTDSAVEFSGERQANDVSLVQIRRIADDGQQVAGVLPEMKITESKIYVFAVYLEMLAVGDPIYLNMFTTDMNTGSVEFIAAEEGKDYVFMNDAGEVIHEVPEGKNVTVAAYMEKGKTYSVVVTTLADYGEDNGPGEASGGCSAGFGALAVMLALPLLLKRKDA